MNAHIETLMQLSIGQIKELETQQRSNNKKILDIIDRQKETMASYLEQNKVDKNWSREFLKDMEIERL